GTKPIRGDPMKHRLLLTLGLGVCLTGTARAQTKRIELSDLQKLVNVSDPQIAPDGKSIACVVSRVNWTDDRFDANLVLVDIASGTQRKLTFDRKGVGSPRWSPSGDRLAFLATAGSGDKAAPQVFVLDMRGGEARQITEAANGVEQYAWKPDGADIAYVTSDDAENKKEIEAHNDAFEVGDDGYLTTAAPTPSHLWTVPVGGGTARRLTHGAWSLAKSQPPGPPSTVTWCARSGCPTASRCSWGVTTGRAPRCGSCRWVARPSASTWARSARRGASGSMSRSAKMARSHSRAAPQTGRPSCITSP